MADNHHAGARVLEGGDCGPLEPLGVQWLHVNSVRFCLIGGQAVNAYVEPLVSLDLDVVVAAADLDRVRTLLPKVFATESFPHSLNVSIPGSDLRIQIQLDARYGAFVDRAGVRDVLGVRLPVARVEDVLQGKIWAVEDSSQRPSKRQKDLADISRLLEKYPHVRTSVPTDILDKLV